MTAKLKTPAQVAGVFAFGLDTSCCSRAIVDSITTTYQKGNTVIDSATQTKPQFVFVLTADLDGDNGDYDGTKSVHATREGALAAFELWLATNLIDSAEAHMYDVTTDTFVGGDSEVDWGGKYVVLHWGINTMEVRA